MDYEQNKKSNSRCRQIYWRRHDKRRVRSIGALLSFKGKKREIEGDRDKDREKAKEKKIKVKVRKRSQRLFAGRRRMSLEGQKQFAG